MTYAVILADRPRARDERTEKEKSSAGLLFQDRDKPAA
jgi:hypothetical protein